MTLNPSAPAEHEEWRDVPGYEGRYSVSNLGNIRSHHRGKTTPMRPFKNSAGYLQVSLSKFGRTRQVLVHRLVAEAFLGARPGPPRANPVHHRDGDRTNNRLDNLEWSDPGSNNLATRLSNRHGYRLTYDRAEEIRAKYAGGGWTYRALAPEYGVSDATICNVVNGKCWVPPTAE